MTIEINIPEIPWETKADGSLKAEVAGIGCYVDRLKSGAWIPRCGNAIIMKRSSDDTIRWERYWTSLDEAKDAVHRYLVSEVHAAVYPYLPYLKSVSGLDALQAIADLPTGENESVMQGHEEAYRAVERLFPAPPTVRVTE